MTPPDFPFPRVSEQTALSLKGVRASVMRLPQVHDPVKQGLITPAIEVYREKGVCAYVGDGLNRWPAAYVLDVNASLQVDAGCLDARYCRSHWPAPGAAGQIHRLGMFAAYDMPASSAQTRKQLGWEPIGPGLIANLEQLRVFDS